jgi:hypothetical protein
LVAGVDAGLPESTPLRWFDDRPSNRWAMFDGETNTATTAATTLTFVLQPGFANALYLAALDADSLTVSIKDAPGGTVVYTYASDLENSEPPDYWEYLFSGFKPQRDILLDDLPPYGTMEVTVTLTGSPATAGLVLIGDNQQLAAASQGPTASPRTNSRITFDDVTGRSSVKRGKKAKDIELLGLVEIDDADQVLDTVHGLLDVICLWSATNKAQYASLRAVGFGSAKLLFDEAEYSHLSISVKGTI